MTAKPGCIRLREDNLKLFCRLAGIGSNTELATRMGIDRGGLGEVLAGKRTISTAFVTALVAAFGRSDGQWNVNLEQLFEIIPIEPDTP